MEKRILSLLMVLALCLTLLPASALAEEPEEAPEDGLEDTLPAEEPEEELPEDELAEDSEDEAVVEVFSDWVEISETWTTAPNFNFFTLDSYGKVALTSGKHAQWIDRIDVPDYAKTLYNTLVQASSGNGCLIDVTQGTLSNGSYVIEVTDFSGTATSQADMMQQIGNTYSEISQYIFAVYEAFDRDHPEVFWLSGTKVAGCSYSPAADYSYKGKIYFVLKGIVDGEAFDVRAEEYQNAESIKTAIETRDDAVKSILGGCTATSTYGKIRYFNTWLTKNNAYNTLVSANNSAAAPKSAWECISALTGRIGTNGPVCEGYARAFKVLCDKVGIPCVLVDGEANGGAHMWNYVQMDDGKWYAVDVTWNDPTPIGGGDQAADSGLENENWLLVGADTVVNGQRFIASHPVSNRVSTNGTSFTNGPVLNGENYKIPITSLAVSGLTAPAKGGTPVTSVTVSGVEAADGKTLPMDSASVTWDPDDSTFAPSTPYTATLTLTAPAGYQFIEDTTKVTVSGVTGATESVSNNGTTLTITVPFRATEGAELTGLTVARADGSTANVAVPTKEQATATVNLTAKAVYDNDQTSTVDVTGDATWSVTAKGVTVSNGVVTITPAASGGPLTITATYQDHTDNITLTLTKDGANVPTSLTVTGATSIESGTEATTKTYTVAGENKYGEEVSNPTVTWSVAPTTDGLSINGGVLTIPAGYEGSVTVKATSTSNESVTGSLNVSITRAASVLTSVALAQTEVTISGYNDDTETQTVQATAYDQYNTPIASGVIWAITSPSTRALNTAVTIDKNTGLVTVGNAAPDGEYTVTATYGGKTATATLIVTRADSAAQTVKVSSDTDTLEIPVTGEVKATFTATVTDQYEETISSNVAWTIKDSDGKDVTGVTIDEKGVVTVEANAKDAITDTKPLTVTATVGGVSGTAEITVKRAAPKATTVTLSGSQTDILVPADNAVANTSTFTATVKDQYGEEMTNANVQWSITPATAGVTISNGTVTVTNAAKEAITDTTGKPLTVTAAVGSASGTAQISVKRAASQANSIKIFSSGAEITSDDTIGIPGSKAYTAVLYDQYGTGMSGNVTLSLESEAPGITLENGTVTVTANTADNTTATLKAAAEDVEKTITITAKQVSVDWSGIALKNPAAITYGDAKSSAFANLPETGTATAYVNSTETTLNGTFSIVGADTLLAAGENQTITVQFTVTDAGDYHGSSFTQDYSVKVNPKPVSVTWSNTALTYNGEAQAPNAKVSTGLVGSDTLTVTVTDQQKNAGSNYTATASIDNANYTLASNTASTIFTIAPKPLTIANGTLAITKEYDGTKDVKNVTGTLSPNGVVEGDTVSVTYDATGSAYADKNAGENKSVTLQVSLTGDSADNYTLESSTYTFTGAVITPKSVTVSGITAANKVYDGTTDATLTLAQTIDGMITGDSLSAVATGAFTDKNAGIAKTVNITNITLIGTDAGNYTLAASGSQTTATVDVARRVLTLGDGDVAVTKVYDGKTDAGTLTGTLALTGAVAGDTVSVNMENVTVGAYDSVGYGTNHTVTLSGIALTGADKDNYQVAETYAFTKAAITKAQQDALAINAENKTYGDADFNIIVTGGSGTGAVTLTSSDPSVLSLTQNGTTFTATIHKAGAVTLTANKAGDSNYEAADAVTKTLTISPKAISADDFTVDTSDKTYTGSAIRPAVTSALTVGTDYDAVYSNNTNVGTAAITITGKGNYTGSVTKNFAITPKSLADADITLGSVADATYTGSAITPSVTVKWGSRTLTKDTDYTLSYTNNTNAGTAAITVTGTGNYTGTATATFTIQPAALTGTVTITGGSGSIKGGDTLNAATSGIPADASVTYQWYNKDAAIAGATNSTYTVVTGDTKLTVKVTASGNYTGTLTSPTVEVDKILLTGSVSVAQETTGGPIKATVTGAPDAENYTIVWLRDGAVIPGATGDTYTVQAADKGCGVSAKIVAKGDVYTGEVVSSSSISIPAEAPTVTVQTTAGNGTATVFWNVQTNGSRISSYQVTLKDENGNVVQTQTLSSDATSCTFTGLTNGKKYTAVVAVYSDQATSTDENTVQPAAPSHSGGSSSSVTTYPVTVDSGKHGSVTTSARNASKGTTVTITVKPDDGYQLDTLRVTDKNGDRVKVTEGKNGKFTFSMPASKVTVEASFVEAEETGAEWPFTDVADDFWAREAIAWVYENGYMNGVSAATFNPDGSVTRQQLWMILARLSGQRPADMAEARAWAMDNGVSDGTNPGNAVSRQQMVTILYRYAAMMGYKTSGGADLGTFPDSAKVAAYAQDAMSWSVGNGIVGGTAQGTLNPAGTATRAQFATILQRFYQNIVG